MLTIHGHVVRTLYSVGGREGSSFVFVVEFRAKMDSMMLNNDKINYTHSLPAMYIVYPYTLW